MPVDLQTSPPPAVKAGGLTGRHVLFALIAFFSVILAVNMTMMTLAIRTMPGSEVKSSYEASQRFNRGLDAIAEQDRRGWQVDIVTTGIRSGGPFSVHVRDRAGEALGGLRVEARIARPADARFDQRIALSDLGVGRYGAGLPELSPGQWLIGVEIFRGDDRLFVSQRRIVLKD